MLPEALGHELADNVRRGLALLDERDPAWWWAERPGGRAPVDLARLREESAVDCVLAQWAGADYRRGLAVLGLERADGYVHGFTALAAGSPDAAREFHPRYNLLTALWRGVIAHRRGAAITGALTAAVLEVSNR
jgi:hypothetical protein